MSNSEKATVACFGCGTCTLVCYVIGMILGWVFSNVTLPDSKVAFAGAVVITIPVFLVLIATFLECCLGDAGGCICCAALTGGCLSGFLDLIGVGLFVDAMVKAASELDSPAGAITCGVFASIFILLAAISNFATLCSLTVLDQAKEWYNTIDS